VSEDDVFEPGVFVGASQNVTAMYEARAQPSTRYIRVHRSDNNYRIYLHILIIFSVYD
jgi:hypothetical protein